jgi:hypothetical protein
MQGLDKARGLEPKLVRTGLLSDATTHAEKISAGVVRTKPRLTATGIFVQYPARCSATLTHPFNPNQA